MIEIRTPANTFDFDFFEARRLAADKPIGMYILNFELTRYSNNNIDDKLKNSIMLYFFSESLTVAKKKAKIAQITSDLSSTESHTKKKKENMKMSMKRASKNSKQPKKFPRSNKLITNQVSI